MAERLFAFGSGRPGANARPSFLGTHSGLELIELSSVIGDIYDAAIDPTLWQQALASICTYIGGSSAALFWHDSATQSAQALYMFNEAAGICAHADDVNKTMDDFHNYGGKNVPLWLRGDLSIHYAGISGDEHVNIVPQAGLNDDETRVTIILPGGSEEKVDNTLDRKDTDELRGKIYGLRGKIGDRVHTTAKVLKDSYRNNRGYAAFQGFMINLKK